MYYSIKAVKNQCEALYIINSIGIAYHQLRKKLYIIKPTEIHPYGVMIYAYGDDIQPTADDMPSLSAWIKNPRSKERGFFVIRVRKRTG